jgi:hypothetical protein
MKRCVEPFLRVPGDFGCIWPSSSAKRSATKGFLL